MTVLFILMIFVVTMTVVVILMIFVIMMTVVMILMTSYYLQEMEMGEKKAPEQTAMVKMGMLGTPSPPYQCHLHRHHNNPPRGGVHALPAQHLGGDALLEVMNPLNFSPSRF